MTYHHLDKFAKGKVCRFSKPPMVTWKDTKIKW